MAMQQFRQRLMLYKTLTVALLCSFLLPSGLVLAADPTRPDQSQEAEKLVSYPYIEEEFTWELENDYTYHSDDSDAELNDLFGYLEFAVTVAVNPYLSFNATLVGEPVLDPDPGEDRVFEDHGLYLEVLNAQINLSEDTNLVVGKFGPGFGTAWDVTPGIYGVDFAEDYELAEFIGLGLNHTFDGGSFGSIAFGANVFFADTTFLSDSIGTHRGQTSILDGGAGNTEKLNNFSFTFDGEEIPDFPGLSWHAGYRVLSAGLGDVADEHGHVLGFTRKTEPGKEQSAIFNFEYAGFENFGGSADHAHYLTAGLTLANGPWHTDFAGTLRNIEVAGGPDSDDVLFQASLGYVDHHDIDWNVGYKFAGEGGVDNHIVGIFITKKLEFSTK
jgi:hypothetical protein